MLWRRSTTRTKRTGRNNNSSSTTRRRRNAKKVQTVEPGEEEATATNDNTDHDNTTTPNENDDKDDEQPDGLTLYKQSNLRPLRKALHAVLELHKRTLFQGAEEEAHYEARRQLRSLKRQKTAEAAQHQKYLAATELRRGRVQRLQQLQSDARAEEETKSLLMSNYMIPDGHVETTTTTNTGNLLLTNQEEGTVDDDNNNTTELPKLRSCYVCKVRYRQLHQFYDQLCPTCAALNWTKRHQTANLQGKVAIVTGSRVKIGFQTCLKLLRAGCRVIATTRFPNSAVAAYRDQADFDQWRHLLHIYGLDLRDVTGLEAFTRHLKQEYPTGIDIVINNACQTVRRPVAYYAPLVQREQTLWDKADEVHQGILGGCRQFERLRRRLLINDGGGGGGAAGLLQASGGGGGGNFNSKRPPVLHLPASSPAAATNSTTKVSTASPETSAAATAAPSSKVTIEELGDGDVAMGEVVTVKSKQEETPFESTGLSHSAAMSQMILLPEDAGVDDSVLPPGISDVNGQQLDLRKTNSWLLKMEQVSTPEIFECMVVNAIAPFLLNSRLKPLMTVGDPKTRPDRYIINVSAMEGKFYRYKMPNHPHTNMAKAALNMLTRTSAEDLATKHRIYMNSVDTGWINDENPLEKAKKTAENNLFQTPIDEVDAAARIVDPIFVGVKQEDKSSSMYGKFLKDYHESEW